MQTKHRRSPRKVLTAAGFRKETATLWLGWNAQGMVIVDARAREVIRNKPDGMPLIVPYRGVVELEKAIATRAVAV